jgi:hypothetical protein
MATTILDVVKLTLEKAGVPLSSEEIWEKSAELGTRRDFVTSGKTPWATISARCYMNIKECGESSDIIQVSSRPQKFFLRKFEVNKSNVRPVKPKVVENEKYKEFDLHPLLVAFASANEHFKANLKTISEKTSGKGTKGENEWLHPDLVGVYFPFEGYSAETRDLQKSLSTTSIKLFSFEMKRSLDFSNLRESFFQAVSNSSWANEGYLAAHKINVDATFRDELRRLSNAFGIGIIELNSDNIFESEIIYPARTNTEIDWDTVNRLTTINQDFKHFLKSITEDCTLGKVKSQYDKVLSPDSLEQYIIEKRIK